MGKRMSELTSRLKDFISRQKLFFVPTAMEEGRYYEAKPRQLTGARINRQSCCPN